MTSPLRSVRRAPVQRRSTLRVERMLDAAAGLLDEVGTEGLTTSGIARAAGVSVGSLYQFFPDKHAVVEALARRSFARFSRRLAALETPGWEQAVDAVVDLYVAFSRDEPGFQVLSFGGPVVGLRALDPQHDNNAVVAHALGQVVGEVDLPDDVLRLAVEIGDAILALAFRRDPAGDPALVAEAKTAVKAYLHAKLR
ncbi:MAG: TetR/AcrR family transcriptional regulator [Frankiales bacterium]|jgi:AcrR family transcriptional regulator|nr:TetR/AcrR family transcriptional regulator [Frankiales bacterium]MCW2586017.1 TetR/AcrR family transcriptional regulator [Frankiales bacterium]